MLESPALYAATARSEIFSIGSPVSADWLRNQDTRSERICTDGRLARSCVSNMSCSEAVNANTAKKSHSLLAMASRAPTIVTTVAVISTNAFNGFWITTAKAIAHVTSPKGSNGPIATGRFGPLVVTYELKHHYRSQDLSSLHLVKSLLDLFE